MVRFLGTSLITLGLCSLRGLTFDFHSEVYVKRFNKK